MWTKICGTTSLDDALLAAELGADALGFIFAASKRQVSVQQVATITPHLPSSVEKVGVFDRPDGPLLVEAIRTAGLTAAQLHFPLDSPLIAKLHAAFEGRLRLIQVVGIPADLPDSGDVYTRVEGALQLAFSRTELFAVLLDTVQGTRSGGTGAPFAWRTAATLLADLDDRAGNPHAGDRDARPHLILAGGLRPENVAQAVRTLQPWGVDAVSGVESSPGAKDPERLSHFLQLTRTM